MWSKVWDDLPLYGLAVLLTGVFAFFAGASCQDWVSSDDGVYAFADQPDGGLAHDKI